MKKNYRAILFDLDGTLLDTAPGILAGLDHVIKEMNLTPVPEDQRYSFVGPSVHITYPKFFGLKGEELEKTIKAYRRYYDEEGYKNYKFYPEITDLLSKLKDKGFFLGVVTNKIEDVTNRQLKESGLIDYFDVIKGNNDNNPQTKAQLIEDVLKNHSLKVDEVAFIGDTSTDAEGAKTMGIDYYPALYGFGYSNGDSYQNYPYTETLERPLELLHFIKAPKKRQPRASGMLAHITSLPGPYGIGTLGEEAKHFVDLLKNSQSRYWQVLPIGPTDEYNSPYTSESAFAGNPFLIDLRDLRERNLITDEELRSCEVEEGWKVDFARVSEDRERIFDLAFSRIDENLKDEIETFAEENPWVEDYALFKAINSDLNRPWYEWPEEYRNRDERALELAESLLQDKILYYKFLQYLFFTQWKALKRYANDNGIEIIGDIPMYLSLESADVWANRENFQIEHGKPTCVAGCPPDYFSPDGQLWGNPIYNWDKLKEEDYAWWIERIRHSFNLYDVLRIDHFRALANYYSIPAEEDTAKNGTWCDGPGVEFFDTLDEVFDNPRYIAENLGGEDSPAVNRLLEETGIPAMRLAEMAFVSYGDNVHLPFHYTENDVAYLGTHDNNTLIGWLRDDLTEGQRNYALEYMDFNHDWNNWQETGPNSAVTHAFIKELWSTPAATTIITLQDALGLGPEHRMNVPGTQGDNWAFRVPSGELDQLNTEWLKFFNMTYQRKLKED